MRPALVIARTDLLRRLRSRAALITAVVGPLALAVVISFSFGGGDASFTIGVGDADRSSASRKIVRGLAGERGPVTFERVAPDVARARIEDGDLDAAIVVPAGYGASRRDAAPRPLVVLRDRPVAGQVAQGIAQGIAARTARARVTAATAGAARLDPQAVAALAADAARADTPFTVERRRPDGGELSITAYFGAAMAVLFLYFTMGMAGKSLHLERRTGTLQRILATPTSPGAIVAGKVLAVAALGALGFLTIWLVTALVFGARWGDPAGVVVLVLATVTAIAGVTLLVATLARTERQAESLTSIAGLVFALLGGNFVSPAGSPPLLRDLSLATPNGWALRGFTDLATGASTAGGVAAAALALVTFGVVFGGLGFVRARSLAGA